LAHSRPLAQVRCVYQFRHARVTAQACHTPGASVHPRARALRGQTAAGGVAGDRAGLGLST